MPSLHIQHPISDLTTWTTAFAAFGEQRRQAGVLSEAVRIPVDDDHFVVIDLEFGTVDQAAAFHRFLQTVVWASNENSPALVGAPDVKILTQFDLTAGTAG